MIATAPLFEANFLTTAKNYWFGKSDPKTPSPEGPDSPGGMRERIMTATRKTTDAGEGGVGGTMRKMLNRRDLLAQAYGD